MFAWYFLVFYCCCFFFANSNSVSQGLISSCVFILIVLCCFVSWCDLFIHALSCDANCIFLHVLKSVCVQYFSELHLFVKGNLPVFVEHGPPNETQKATPNKRNGLRFYGSVMSTDSGNYSALCRVIFQLLLNRLATV